MFRGTTVYLAAVLAAALKCAGDVAVNRGLEADGGKFSDAKPHADWDGGHGNPVCPMAPPCQCCTCMLHLFEWRSTIFAHHIKPNPILRDSVCMSLC